MDIGSPGRGWSYPAWSTCEPIVEAGAGHHSRVGRSANSATLNNTNGNVEGKHPVGFAPHPTYRRHFDNYAVRGGMMGWATWLKPDNSVPVGDIHVNALEFAWEKHAVVGDKIAGLLQFVHPLFEPML